MKKTQNNLLQDEWLIKAKNDLGSAEILIKGSEYFDIIVYQCHQSIEKLLKWFLIKHNRAFPFIHDLVSLFKLCEEIQVYPELRKPITEIQSLLPRTRYPDGDSIEKEEAIQSLSIARRIFQELA